MKVLVDEMYDGLDLEIRKLGYEAYSVKKLKREEEKLGHDFNVISYAKEHGIFDTHILELSFWSSKS